jgi:hypothetical protein
LVVGITSVVLLGGQGTSRVGPRPAHPDAFQVAPKLLAQAARIRFELGPDHVAYG